MPQVSNRNQSVSSNTRRGRQPTGHPLVMAQRQMMRAMREVRRIVSNPEAAAPSRLGSPRSGNSASGSTTNFLGGNTGDATRARSISRALPQEWRRSAQRHFPFILQEARRQGVTDKNQLAYILATAAHESHAGGRMIEQASGRRYEGRSDLGNTQPGDGPRFKGRGYVQLTGRVNYQRWSDRTGRNLVRNPELVTRPEIAARVLVQGMRDGEFTGASLGSYVDGRRTDFRNARRVINGLDRADDIADMARDIRSRL